MNEVIVLAHDQPVHHPPWIDPSVGPSVAGGEWPVRKVVKEESEGDSDHESRCEPAVEDERKEIKSCGSDHDHSKDAALESPLKQFPAFPETTLKEKPLVIEKSWSNQPEGAEGAHDVIRIVLGIIDVGMVFQVDPGEHREAEPCLLYTSDAADE